jgi:hypothetical protein
MTLVGSRCGEEGASGTQHIPGIGMTGGTRHWQGLKPDSFAKAFGTAEAVP